jgi:hypothetical protein
VEDGEAQSQRDRHIQLVAVKSRIASQKATGYGRHGQQADGAVTGPVTRSQELAMNPALTTCVHTTGARAICISFRSFAVHCEFRELSEITAYLCLKGAWAL